MFLETHSDAGDVFIWIHVEATCKALFKRPSPVAVTPKHGDGVRQWKPAALTLAGPAVLFTAALYGLFRDRTPATLNHVGFLVLHM